jgi:hypothetical protein
MWAAGDLTHLAALKTLSLHHMMATDLLPPSLTALAVQECYSLQPCSHLPNLQRLVLRKVLRSTRMGAHLPSLAALRDLDLTCGSKGSQPTCRYDTPLSQRVHHSTAVACLAAVRLSGAAPV